MVAFLRVPRRGSALSIAVVLLVATGALAATHFRSGALYTGQDSACGSSVPGTTCVFRFRASTDGLSLRFIGKTVIDTWGCHGGGGEALLGGRMKYAAPIPLVKLSSDGKLHGSTSWVLRPASAPPETHTISVTGHISRAGKAAVITLHDSFRSPRSKCSIEPVMIVESGSSLGGAH